MNRPIKFRIWDREIESWVKEQVGDGPIYTIGLDGTVREQYYSDHGKVECCEIQQFTGLTDMTGGEIYEGDIVEQISEPRALNGKCQVVYPPGIAGFYLFDKFETAVSLDSIGGEAVIIVGNVFENTDWKD